MSLINRDNLINILSNTKDKIDNKINRIKVDSFETTTNEIYTKNTNIPYKFYSGSAVAIGTDIYLLGNYKTSSDSNSSSRNYKYDITTDTYTKNKDIPYLFNNASAVAIGKIIYLFGGAIGASDYRKYTYKYDTTTNTYTNIGEAPGWFGNSTSTVVNDYAYIFQGNSAYRYDPNTNKYTTMANMPSVIYQGNSVAINNSIYLLGSYYSGTTQNHYRYDISTNTYSKLSNTPYQFCYASAVGVKNNIYLLGGQYSNTANYKYDTITDTYSANKTIPVSFVYGSAVSINNDIYLLGSNSGSTNISTLNYKYSVPYNTNAIIKPTNHSIYTTSKSYVDAQTSLVPIGDDYYTEYDKNSNIIKNTYPISSDGTTKMYIKSGAILNGKEISCESEGWQTINILDYM